MMLLQPGVSISLVLFVLAFQTLLEDRPVDALENGLARKPPMGWLAWERFTCQTNCTAYPNHCIDQNLFKTMARRLSEDGFKQLGYKYINIDDCWSEMVREPTSGQLVSSRSRFPAGMRELAEHVHALGLKLGLYGDCGTKTCAGYPGQLKSELNLEDNYFELDAKTLAEWKIDSFKFDGCNLSTRKAELICPKMAMAIGASGRPMLITCEWPFYMMRFGEKVNFKLATEACNMIRYYEDVEDTWLSVLNIVDFTVKHQATLVQHHGPGSWFDPDQLVIGNFGLSFDQARAQMALWSVWAAPLFMSNDLRHLEPEMAAILKAEQVIDVDQDQLGVLGLLVASSDKGLLQAFVKPVEPIRNGCPSFAVVYLNRNTLGSGQKVNFGLRALLLGAPLEVAAQRYGSIYAGKLPGGHFDASQCQRRLHNIMSRPQSEHVLRPPNAQEPLESTELWYSVADAFGDPLDGQQRVGIDANLSLSVNPSGVRMVVLTELAPTEGSSAAV